MMGHRAMRRSCRWPKEASKAGIKMMYQNVPVDDVAAKFGGGYVGAQQDPQGRALGEEAIRRFGLASGDVAIVIGDWSQIERGERERGTRRGVRRRPASRSSSCSRRRRWAADPNLGDPGDHRGHRCTIPTSRLIGYPGGQLLGNAADLHAGGRQEAGRDRQHRVRHEPADRRWLQGRLGAAHLGPAAVPAGLHADPQPVPAGRLRSGADQRRHRRRLRHPRQLRGRRGSAKEGLR